MHGGNCAMISTRRKVGDLDLLFLLFRTKPLGRGATTAEMHVARVGHRAEARHFLLHGSFGDTVGGPDDGM